MKTAVKKVVAAEIQRVPSAFNDDMIAEPHPKGFSSCLWCDLRFNICCSYSPSSENKLVDIQSFSDGATGAEKTTTDSVVVADAGGVAPHPSSPQDQASPELTRDLDRTVQRNEDPIENLPVVETREELPEGQDPSPSVAAFNENFGTSYRGKLLSVSREWLLQGVVHLSFCCCGIHLNSWMKQQRMLHHRRSNYPSRPFVIRRSSLLLL
jgi:hypothetical protein